MLIVSKNTHPHHVDQKQLAGKVSRSLQLLQSRRLERRQQCTESVEHVAQLGAARRPRRYQARHRRANDRVVAVQSVAQKRRTDCEYKRRQRNRKKPKNNNNTKSNDIYYDIYR